MLLPFLAVISDSHGLQKLVVGLFAATLGVLAGLLSYRFIERRFLRIKETRFTAPQDRLRSEMAAGDVPDPGPGRPVAGPRAEAERT